MLEPGKAPAQLVQNTGHILGLLKPDAHGLQAEYPIKRFIWDSRLVEEGDVFVAIKGARRDGHDFVENALVKGAAACLVSSFDKLTTDRRCIRVDDTVAALGYLAAAHRRACGTRIIAITGSVGKTTTKDMLHGMLNYVYGAVKSEGNLNSTIGLPTQLLALTPEDRYMVAEMGMSYPGEIAKLMEIALPDVGIWTAVYPVHLSNFKNVEQIAQAKAEMVSGLSREDTLVYNADDALVVKYAENYPGTQITYGFRNLDAMVKGRIEPFPSWNGTHFEVQGLGYECSLFLPVVGAFNVRNALAACAAALQEGLSPADINASLANFKTMPGRSFLQSYSGDIKIVDDTYNSNPQALNRVLRAFAPLPPNTWRWFVVGDMLELGPDEVNIHYKMGCLLAEYGFDRVTFVGPLCETAYRGFLDVKSSGTLVEHFPDAATAVAQMEIQIPSRARVWLKGSRGIRLEKVVRAIESYFEYLTDGPTANVV